MSLSKTLLGEVEEEEEEEVEEEEVEEEEDGRKIFPGRNIFPVIFDEYV